MFSQIFWILISVVELQYTDRIWEVLWVWHFVDQRQKTKSLDIPGVINSITKIRRLLCKLCKYETQPLRSYLRNEIFNDVDIFNYHQASELTPKWDQCYYRISAGSGGHFCITSDFIEHVCVSCVWKSETTENNERHFQNHQTDKLTGPFKTGLFFDSGQNLTISWWTFFPYLFPYPNITFDVSFKKMSWNYTIGMEMLWEKKYHNCELFNLNLFICFSSLNYIVPEIYWAGRI